MTYYLYIQDLWERIANKINSEAPTSEVGNAVSKYIQEHSNRLLYDIEPDAQISLTDQVAYDNAGNELCRFNFRLELNLVLEHDGDSDGGDVVKTDTYADVWFSITSPSKFATSFYEKFI